MEKHEIKTINIFFAENVIDQFVTVTFATVNRKLCAIFCFFLFANRSFKIDSESFFSVLHLHSFAFFADY